MTFKPRREDSRTLAVAEGLLGRPVNRAEMYGKEVLLTAESAALQTKNGRWCLLDALMLLARVVGRLTVMLPDEAKELRSDIEFLTKEIWSNGSIRILDKHDSGEFSRANAILNIGRTVPTSLPWTSISSNGWVARVSSTPGSQSTDSHRDNPVAALMAASLGVSEVFKRILEVPHEVAPPLAPTEFSLFDWSTSPANTGPQMPAALELQSTLIAGCGAIGNGLALLLSQMNIRGKVHLVDKQDYAEENLGTSLLVEENWIGKAKAQRLAQWIRSRSHLDVTYEKGTIEAAISRGLMSEHLIEVVLGGLDNSEARRELQRLWPSIIVDGGISEVGAAVTNVRLNNPEMACLRCLFAEPLVSERKAQGEMTGLSRSALDNPERTLTEFDIAAAPESHKEWLQECMREGKTVCSIISEAMLRSSLGVSVEKGFRPSVPFVATAAASLVMAESIRAQLFPKDRVVSQSQLGNLFLGPQASVRVDMRPTSTCICVAHRPLILRTRGTAAN